MNCAKYSQVGLAVAVAIAASQSASALNVADTLAAPTQLVAAGASAARDSFLQVFNSELCQAGTVTVYRATPTSGQDFRAYSCTLIPASAVPNSVGKILGDNGIAGTNATLYYRSEGGSAWGPLSIAYKSINGAFTGVKSLVVSAGCSAAANANFTIGNNVYSIPTSNCPISGTYSLNDDVGTVTAGLTDRDTQLGVADVEPKLFTVTNFPSTNKFGAETSALIAANKGLTYTTGFGQVFGILLNTTGGSTSLISNLRSTDVTSILSGNYTSWDQVNPAYGANPITVVRREPGSGTQVGAGVQFLRVNCGDSYVFVTDGSDPDSAPTAAGDAADTDGVIERGTTSDLEASVGRVANSISFNIYKPSAPTNTKYISLDGIFPDRAVAGSTYPYAFESTLTKKPGLTGSANGFATALQSIAKIAGILPDNNSVFAIPSATNTPGGSSNGRPIAISSRGGNSCKPFQGQ